MGLTTAQEMVPPPPPPPPTITTTMPQQRQKLGARPHLSPPRRQLSGQPQPRQLDLILHLQSRHFPTSIHFAPRHRSFAAYLCLSPTYSSRFSVAVAALRYISAVRRSTACSTTVYHPCEDNRRLSVGMHTPHTFLPIIFPILLITRLSVS